MSEPGCVIAPSLGLVLGVMAHSPAVPPLHPVRAGAPNGTLLDFFFRLMPRSRALTISYVTALTAALVGVLSPPSSAEDLRVSFGHELADFTGPVPFGDAPMALDPGSGEVLVAQGRDVKVFNEFGMQVFRLRSPHTLATVLDLAVEPDGNVITLARDLDAPGDRPRVAVTRHNFRGAALGEIAITGAPPPFDTLLPNRVFCRGERLIFANTSQLLALVTRRDGTFERGYDLGEILEVEPEDRDTLEISGLDVDRDGNLLLTSAVLFRAFEISPEGALAASWGQSGSARGTFGVVSGITRDEAGRTYVADKNRGVVMVFDRSHDLIAEYAGEGRRFLALPSRLLVDPGGRLYVTQIGSRSVWVFDVRSN